MNKAELVTEITGKVGMTKKDAANVVDAFIGTITNFLSNLWISGETCHLFRLKVVH